MSEWKGKSHNGKTILVRYHCGRLTVQVADPKMDSFHRITWINAGVDMIFDEEIGPENHNNIALSAVICATRGVVLWDIGCEALR